MRKASNAAMSSQPGSSRMKKCELVAETLPGQSDQSITVNYIRPLFRAFSVAEFHLEERELKIKEVAEE